MSVEIEISNSLILDRRTLKNLFFGFLSGDSGATGGTDLDDDLVTGGDHGDAVDVQVADLDGIEDVEVADVDGDDLRKILGEAVDLDLADRLFQLTTTHDARGAAFDGQRKGHGDRFVIFHQEEVGVQHVVGHRMILDILEDGVVRFAVDGDVDDESFRGEEDLLEVLGLGGEMDLILAAIKDTRH